MTTPRIAVVGSCNMDVYTWTSRLPEPGETVIGDRYWMVMGGKGANQAVAACRQGAQVSMIGRVGNDLFGERMLETLTGYGVDTSCVRVDPAAGSGVALVVVDQRPENIIVVVPGANMCIDAADVDAAAGRISEADVLMMQLEIPLATIERALKTARAGKTTCILNPAPGRPLEDDLLRQVDLLTPNQNEARILTGIPADTLEGAEAAGKALLARGAPAVVVTLGAQGSLLVRPGETRHVEGVRVDDSIDSSGAGDAFMGGLSVALAEGKSLLDSVRYANVVGALSTRRRGAMPSMPGRAEVEAKIKELR